jgi:type IV pilus assembly protein PilZ
MSAVARDVDKNLKPKSPQTGLLTVAIKDTTALHQAYIPFVKNGGLFVPTTTGYQLGDEVLVLLSLLGEKEKTAFAGRVVWLTPKGAGGRRPAGIGVQFHSQDRGQTQQKIESLLAGTSGGDRPTHTM